MLLASVGCQDPKASEKKEYSPPLEHLTLQIKPQLPPLSHPTLFLLPFLTLPSSSSSSYPLPSPLPHPIFFFLLFLIPSSFASSSHLFPPTLLFLLFLSLYFPFPPPFPSSPFSSSFLSFPFSFLCVFYSDYDLNSIHKINKNLLRFGRLQ